MCRACREVLGYAKGSTGSLSKHLQAKHKSLYDQAKHATTIVESAVIGAQQVELAKRGPTQPVLQHFDSRQYASGHTERLKRDTALVHTTVHRKWPTSIVSDSSFRYLMATMDPRYQLPCVKTLRKQILQQAESTMLSTRQVLKEAWAVSFSLDGGTMNRTYFVAINAHFISKDGLFLPFGDVSFK